MKLIYLKNYKEDYNYNDFINIYYILNLYINKNYILLNI